MQSVLCALLVAVGLCYLSVCAARPTEEDLGDVAIEMQGINNRDAIKTLPEKLIYSVVFNGGKRQKMHLTKQQTLREFSVNVIGQNGLVSKLDLAGAAGEDVAFYVDPDTKAAMTLSVPRSSRQSSHHNMEGTFYHDGGLYSISHRGKYARGLNAFPVTWSKDRSTAHRVSRVILTHEDYDNLDLQQGTRKLRSVHAAYEESVARNPGASAPYWPRNPGASAPYWPRNVGASVPYSPDGFRQRRQTKTRYTVDMMYISDYYMYQRIQSWLAGTGLPNTPNDVAREVAIILATAANQVNLIYNLINTPTWSVKTNLTAMYIITTAAQSSWENTLISAANPNGIPTMNVEIGLSKFSSWLTTYLLANAIPRADHTALFTGYDIYTLYAGVSYYGVCGLAYVGTACTTYGNAVVELLSTTLLGQIHAHELGHSLSAWHDGSGTNTACDPSLGYVMAAGQPSPTAPYYEQFSNCSLGVIGVYLAKKQTCFTSNMAPYDFAVLQPAYGVPLGMRYTVHDQCRMRFGENYRACGGAHFGQRVCSQLRCYDMTQAHVSWITAGRALDGTPCGNTKWCVQGSCVIDSSAPVGNDACPLGDLSPNLPVYTDSPLTCSSLQPKDCYTKSTADSCCARCESFYNARLPACPYGDLYTNCGTNQSWFCANYGTECCQTCADYDSK